MREEWSNCIEYGEKESTSPLKESKYYCNRSIQYYKLDVFLIFIKKSTFLSYVYEGQGVKGPKLIAEDCRAQRAPSPL